MGLLSKVTQALGFGARKSALDSLPDFLRYPESRAGVPVTWRTAIEVAAVYACVRAIAEGLAQVPIRFYDGSEDTLRRIRNHPLEPLLTRQPNRWQTAFEFIETMAIHAALTGNAFAFVNKVGPERRVVELIPIAPGRVTVYRRADLSLEYHVSAEVPDQTGLSQGLSQIGSGQVEKFPAEAIWHFRGPSWNGWMGLESVKLAREAIGLGIATELAHAKMHKNGVRPGATYSVDGKLTDEQHKKLTAWIEDHVAGDNAFRPLVLDNGAKLNLMGMTGVDAQHIETRKFQVEEICRYFRMQPIVIGFTDKTATYASSEQMFIHHVVHCLAPWAARFEQSARAALCAPDDPAYIKLHLNGLMRGDAKARGEYYSKALGHGGGQAWMTPNEVREEEGVDWIKGGDVLPAQMGHNGGPPMDAPQNDGVAANA